MNQILHKCRQKGNDTKTFNCKLTDRNSFEMIQLYCGKRFVDKIYVRSYCHLAENWPSSNIKWKRKFPKAAIGGVLLSN